MELLVANERSQTSAGPPVTESGLLVACLRPWASPPGRLSVCSGVRSARSGVGDFPSPSRFPAVGQLQAAPGASLAPTWAVMPLKP